MYIWTHIFFKYAIYYTHNSVSSEYIAKPKHKIFQATKFLILVNVFRMKGKPSETVDDGQIRWSCSPSWMRDPRHLLSTPLLQTPPAPPSRFRLDPHSCDRIQSLSLSGLGSSSKPKGARYGMFLGREVAGRRQHGGEEEGDSDAQSKKQAVWFGRITRVLDAKGKQREQILAVHYRKDRSIRQYTKKNFFVWARLLHFWPVCSPIVAWLSGPNYREPLIQWMITIWYKKYKRVKP
jgi:hypothetical protein